MSLLPPIIKTCGRSASLPLRSISCSRTSMPPLVSPLKPSLMICQPLRCAASSVHRCDGRTPKPKGQAIPYTQQFHALTPLSGGPMTATIKLVPHCGTSRPRCQE